MSEELGERLEWLAKWLDSYAGADITSGDDTLAELVRKAADFIASAQSRLALSEAKARRHEDELARLHEARQLSEAREARIAEVLKDCAHKFREYEAIHAGKGNIGADVKARANAAMAEDCERALSTLSPAAAGLLKIKEAAMPIAKRVESGRITTPDSRGRFTLVPVADLLDLHYALAALTRTER